MSLNLERAAMRGKLADARQRRQQLELRIEGGALAIRQALNTALTPVAELAVPQIAAQMDELTEAWAELQATLAEIGRLEKELN